MRNADKNQEIVADKELTPQQVVRERVARAICDKEVQGIWEDKYYFCLADAAIAAHLEALIEMELPEEALDEASRPFWFPVLDKTPKHDLQKAFRAILRKLQGGAK